MLIIFREISENRTSTIPSYHLSVLWSLFHPLLRHCDTDPHHPTLNLETSTFCDDPTPPNHSVRTLKSGSKRLLWHSDPLVGPPEYLAIFLLHLGASGTVQNTAHRWRSEKWYRATRQNSTNSAVETGWEILNRLSWRNKTLQLKLAGKSLNRFTWRNKTLQLKLAGRSLNRFTWRNKTLQLKLAGRSLNRFTWRNKTVQLKLAGDLWIVYMVE
jgi:hypothetical protein